MKALDKLTWAEHLGFIERGVFKIKQEQGVRIYQTIRRLEYKEDNSTFV